MRIRRWPPYKAARARLDAEAAYELEAELVNWALGLAVAELEGRIQSHAGTVGKVGWLELRGFRVLARLSVDAAGHPQVLTLLDLRQR